ncbi:hypothetical protein IFM61606_09651 [Aspergillus udagawae]|uniref:Uncharacterized protein n=1 Tax=Aspergillus udagawae TaxID=91492 RepID=A0ABQ1BCD4_9EURO|nr:hypothetical protein IFM61606_09651 [Aspergillus udagawae]GFF26716.1 hypothetical protein IFM51744_00069 [Aspergillus udagawae]GFF98386.1 hypothetical protein IFM53868_09774 [Aspergillus udagawae]GFG10855.1 hypothetical protein IFM5058_05134 [Aspergillus udagawae]
MNKPSAALDYPSCSEPKVNKTRVPYSYMRNRQKRKLHLRLDQVLQAMSYDERYVSHQAQRAGLQPNACGAVNAQMVQPQASVLLRA